MKKVAIVILNFNGEKDTIQCLKSIEKLQITNCRAQVITVDNGSMDGLAVISNFKFSIFNFQFILIKNKTNLGYAGGNNVGIRYALTKGADYILVLNNDTIVDRNLVDELLKTAESSDKIGIVVPKIYFAKGFEFHKNKYRREEEGKVIWYAGGVMDWENIIGFHRGVDEVDRGQYNDETETEFASGCCLLVKKKVFEKIGLFDEKYFLYYEDNDFCQRAKRAGFKVYYCPKAVLWHKNAGSVGGSGSNLQDYYIARNRLLFGLRYAPLKSKIFLLKESLRLLFLGRSWQKKGIIDFYLRRFGRGGYPL